MNASLGVPCLLRVTTGLDCPLCGATRATFRLLRGDVVGALDLNALWVLAIPLLAVWAVLAWRRRRSFTIANPMPLFAVAIAFGVLRNLPWTPFTVLGT